MTIARTITEEAKVEKYSVRAEVTTGAGTPRHRAGIVHPIQDGKVTIIKTAAGQALTEAAVTQEVTEADPALIPTGDGAMNGMITTRAAILKISDPRTTIRTVFNTNYH